MIDRIGFEDARLQRMEQASLWLQRMRSAAPDDRMVDEWLDWCQSDTLNQQAFDEVAAVWDIAGRMPHPRAAAAPARTPAGISRRAMAASIAGLGLAGIGGAWWAQSRDPVTVTALQSPTGTNRTWNLADGSVLELGGGTRVTVRLGRRQRHVELHEGELFVAVHHDRSRPFSVSSGELDVVATGTAFNVQRTAARTTVTVTEGSVATFQEVRVAEANVLLTGQQLGYLHASHSVDVRDTDAAQATAWRSGVLYFQGVPLSEVIASVNRYATTAIAIEGEATRNFSYTGTVHTNAIDSWLEALPFSFDLTVVKSPDGRRRIGPRPAARRN